MTTKYINKGRFPFQMSSSKEEQPPKICAVFVCNIAYFDKFNRTCTDLINKGEFAGDICLLVANDLAGSALLEQCPLIKSGRVEAVHFPDLYFPPEWRAKWQEINREPHWLKKIVQYNKFYVFHRRFRAYDYVLYLDCGIHILGPVQPILDEATPGVLLAHSDAYPKMEWTLDTQFDWSKPEYYDLVKNYGRGGGLWMDYFQTTMMLISTTLIQDHTFDELYQLALKYPISITNDQGITALYFTCVVPVFQQLRIQNQAGKYLYDYMFRDASKNYVMVKSYRFSWECD